MSDSIKRTLPGGRQVTNLSAFAEGWRTALTPLLDATGWKIHSFGLHEVKLVSPDHKQTQTVSRVFFEALEPLLKK